MKHLLPSTEHARVHIEYSPQWDNIDRAANPKRQWSIRITDHGTRRLTR